MSTSLNEKESGLKIEGSASWSDSQIVGHKYLVTLKKLEVWTEENGIYAIRQTYLQNYNQEDKKVIEGDYHGSKRNIDAPTDILELETDEFLTKIACYYNAETLCAISALTSTDRVIDLGAKPEDGELESFELQANNGQHIASLYGKHKEFINRIDMTTEETFGQSFEFGKALPESICWSEIEKLETIGTTYKISSVTLWGKNDQDVIGGVQFFYMTAEGDKMGSRRHLGTLAGSMQNKVLELENTEFLQEVIGEHDDQKITYLEFRTSEGKAIYQGVKRGTDQFSYKAHSESQLSCFQGRLTDCLVSISAKEIPICKIERTRGDTFMGFEKVATQERNMTITPGSFKDTQEGISEMSEDEEKFDRKKLEGIEQGRTSHAATDVELSTKTVILPTKRSGPSESEEIASQQTRSMYHDATDKKMLEKAFLRRDVFVCLLWFGVAVNASQIFLCISSSNLKGTYFFSALTLSVVSILSFLYGLKIADQKLIWHFNQLGALLFLIFVASIVLMTLAILHNQEFALFLLCFIASIVIIPVYVKKRGILKAMYFVELGMNKIKE